MQQKSNKKANVQKVFWDWDIGDEGCYPAILIFNESGETVFTWFVGMDVTRDIVLNTYTNRIEDYGTNWQRAKNFTERYGITPANTAKIFNGIRYKYFIQNHPEWFNLIRAKSTSISSEVFWSLAYEDLYKQVLKDGLKNILPLVVLFQKSPQELKELLGNKVWKDLCKNSYTRNRYIFKNLGGNATKDYAGFVEQFNQYPSTLLSKGWSKYPIKALQMAMKETGAPMCKLDKTPFVHDVKKVLDLYRDTKWMLEQAGLPFNENWSYRRMKEEHDNIPRRQAEMENQRRAKVDAEYAKLLAVDFRTLHRFLEPITFESGVVATPLTNMQQVQEEGTKMKHCVGGYATRCAQGSYVVWHLTKGSEEVTLGIDFSNYFYYEQNMAKTNVPKKYTFSQMYHSCNRVVEDEDFKKAAEKILDRMNKAAKIESKVEMTELETT